MPTLEDLQMATHQYYDRIVADVKAGRFLAEGAGQRLDEKPRKNWHSRLPSVIIDCEHGSTDQARTMLQNCVNAWRDHVGLLKHYLDTHQMSLEHVLDYFGGQLSADELTGTQTNVQSWILTKMMNAAPQETLAPHAFSIGAEQYRRLALGDVCGQ